MTTKYRFSNFRITLREKDHNPPHVHLMGPDFDPIESAEAWAMSNAPVFNMVAHKVSLDMFSEAGMERLRSKSILLTGYLEYILAEVEKSTGQKLHIITPKDASQRGCQLSIIVEGRTKKIVQDLADAGIVVDWREPNVIRMAPVPMYNSFGDVYLFGQRFSEILKK